MPVSTGTLLLLRWFLGHPPRSLGHGCALRATTGRQDTVIAGRVPKAKDKGLCTGWPRDATHSGTSSAKHTPAVTESTLTSPHRRAYTQTATDAPTHAHSQTHAHTYLHPSPGDTCAGVCPHAHSLSHRHVHTQTRIFTQTRACVLAAPRTLTGHARTDNSAGPRVHARAQTHRKCTWGCTPGDRLTDPHVHAHAHLGTPSHVHTHIITNLSNMATHQEIGTESSHTAWVPPHHGANTLYFPCTTQGHRGNYRGKLPQMNKPSPAPSQAAKMPPRMGPPHTNMCGL